MVGWFFFHDCSHFCCFETRDPRKPVPPHFFSGCKLPHGYAWSKMFRWVITTIFRNAVNLGQTMEDVNALMFYFECKGHVSLGGQIPLPVNKLPGQRLDFQLVTSGYSTHAFHAWFELVDPKPSWPPGEKLEEPPAMGNLPKDLDPPLDQQGGFSMRLRMVRCAVSWAFVSVCECFVKMVKIDLFAC